MSTALFFSGGSCSHGCNVERRRVTSCDTADIVRTTRCDRSSVSTKLIDVVCPQCSMSFNRVRDERGDCVRECVSCGNRFTWRPKPRATWYERTLWWWFAKPQS